jgi:hypothetical protein
MWRPQNSQLYFKRSSVDTVTDMSVVDQKGSQFVIALVYDYRYQVHRFWHWEVEVTKVCDTNDDRWVLDVSAHLLSRALVSQLASVICCSVVRVTCEYRVYVKQIVCVQQH